MSRRKPIGSRALFRLDDVHTSYGNRRVIMGVSVDLPPGSISCVIGPSGSGKSTLLACARGLLPIQRGQVTLGDTVIATAGERAGGRVDKLDPRIGLVFQDFHLWLHRTVSDNLALAPRCVSGVSRAEALARARAVLDALGVAEFADRRASDLSGGERQRVAIARALMMSPEVLLLDEVTSALDPEWVFELAGLLRSLAARGTAVLLVTHHIGLVRHIADRVVVLDAGRVVEDGGVARVLGSPSSLRAAEFIRKLLT